MFYFLIKVSPTKTS